MTSWQHMKRSEDLDKELFDVCIIFLDSANNGTCSALQVEDTIVHSSAGKTEKEKMKNSV